MKALTNEQKQVILSGILGDGRLKHGRAFFSCIHKEYMELKKKLLGDIGLLVERKENNGYKKGAFIYKLQTLVHPEIKKYESYSIEGILKELDELGIALWVLDDGSRHKKNNFYNINTHALDRQIEEDLLIPFFNKLNIFPKITTETKKDGRCFSYLYIAKWVGAMEISRILRKIPLECYSYKLMPIEMEEAYFKYKDLEEFKDMTSLQKTAYIKNEMGLKQKNKLLDNVTSTEMIFTDSRLL